MPRRINIAIAAAALSVAPIHAQTGWTIYAPGQAPSEHAVTIYGKVGAVGNVERAAEALGWKVADTAKITGRKAFAVLKESCRNAVKGQHIWRVARDSGVRLVPLGKCEAPRKRLPP